MAGSITTAYCTSAKSEHYAGGHCFQASVTPTGDTTSSAFTIANVSAMTGVVVGMGVSGTGIPTGTVVASIDSATGLTLSKAATATGTGVTLTIAGDAFKVALFLAGASLTGTYGAATTNYADMTTNSDEASGTGYTAGGTALTNVSPTTSGTTAYVNFSPNPSWTSATITTSGCMIYNTATRLGGASGSNNTVGNNRAVGVFSFGADQSVSNGTLTLILPAATATTAIFFIA